MFKLGGEGGGGDAENEGDEGVDSEVQGGVGGHGEEEEDDDDEEEEEGRIIPKRCSKCCRRIAGHPLPRHIK